MRSVLWDRSPRGPALFVGVGAALPRLCVEDLAGVWSQGMGFGVMFRVPRLVDLVLDKAPSTAAWNRCLSMAAAVQDFLRRLQLSGRLDGEAAPHMCFHGVRCPFSTTAALPDGTVVVRRVARLTQMYTRVLLAQVDTSALEGPRRNLTLPLRSAAPSATKRARGGGEAEVMS